MRAWPLLLLLLLAPAALWSVAADGQGFLLDDEDEEEVMTREELELAELKRLIREKRFDYVFRGIDTPSLAGRRITINREPLSDGELERRILAPIFRVEVSGTTAAGSRYQLDRRYLFEACRRGPEEGRWLDRYPIYRCIL